MSDFYGITPGTIPGFAEVGSGKFMGVGSLPEETLRHMIEFMEKLRGMYREDELAFEICVRHVAAVIEDQRRSEGRTDPREDPDSLLPVTLPMARSRPGSSSRLQDGAAGRHLKGGDAPTVEDNEPVAVPAAQDAVIVRQGQDGMLRGLVRGTVGLVVGDVQVLATDQVDAQHDLCHGQAP